MRNIIFLIISLCCVGGIVHAQYVANRVVQERMDEDDQQIARCQTQIDEWNQDKQSILNDIQANEVVAKATKQQVNIEPNMPSIHDMNAEVVVSP